MQSKVRERRQNPRVKQGKPLRPSAAIWESFGNEITEEITLFWRDITREMKAAFRDTAYETGLDASITTDARVRLNALREKWTVRFNKLAKSAVDKMIQRVDKNSLVTLNMSLREVAKGLEIDTAYTDQRMIDVIQASTQEAAQLIKRIPSMYLDQVQGEVMRSITTGQGMKELVPFLTEKYEGNVKWARHVAMDQTRKSYAAVNKVRLQKFGCEEYTWRHSGGSRYPRKEHIAMSGNVYRWDDPPVIDKRTGEKGHPGDAIFCHPASSNVESTNGIRKLFRRSYGGKASRLVTASGKTIEATPNHPVLTSVGWKPIEQVNVGDYLVNAVDKSANFFKTDVENGSPTIGHLFDAALSLVGLSRTHAGGSELEFHGDMSDGEISVIDIDGFLPAEMDAAFCKRFCEFFLAWANVTHIGRDSEGSPHEALMRAFGANERFVRSASAFLALLKSHSGHARDIRRALASDIHATLNQDTANWSARDIESLGKLQLTYPGVVERNDFCIREFAAIVSRAFDFGNIESTSADEFAKIVGSNSEGNGAGIQGFPVAHALDRVVDHVIFELPLGSHVYNLETSRNWFTSNGLIVHNCRCIAVPLFRFADD